ncbi:MAG: hypothetical protein HZA78_02875 [Candidatus Schekmanbacteria bacterium]|nr:hypothetical protein [Candidatus Schekmanbacteria bacterium]
MLTSLLLIVILLTIVLIQGYFIALLQLDQKQALIMLRPVYIYILPAYYYIGKWLGEKLPGKMFLLTCMSAVTSFVGISLINHLWMKLPLPSGVIDLYTLICFIAVSLSGGINGKRKFLTAFQAKENLSA